MERIRKIFERRISYEPLEGGSEGPNGEQIEHPKQHAGAFSWIDYSVFLLLGVAMLWAWNMFLAAAPYFQKRFEADDRLLRNFQSAELSVSTVGNLGSMIVLTKLQARASYPKRIVASLVLNIVVFTLLAISTRIFLGVSPGVYFGFLMVVVFVASLATGLCQNGVFAFVSGFGHEEYTQGIMAGQGIAGVLPCIAQIISVLSVSGNQSSENGAQGSSTSAFAYFLTASAVSAITLVAFVYLLSRNSAKDRLKDSLAPDEDEAGLPLSGGKKSIPLTVLFRKLFWLAAAVFLTFALTMLYPVYTSQIQSVRDPATSSRIYQPATFIPIAFLFWNLGDLTGRMLPAIPKLSLTAYPRTLFILSASRIAFIPLYLLCNLQGKGAKVNSDFFYLFIVQALFGVTNGYIGSNCMMGFVEWVDPEEREAAGGFMSLCLVAGLTVGSFMSFFAAG
ncbi:nucleoside transporter family [Aaosphaeria arxii CBS 175.79]|uniref:Nucleoside transporter family n=1 Tax=Aaosphaeria arxii CBS 175.79 TaxID=1450172 RepID=A0A6A5XS40_9PLEO|nr:nucleoside transporter family [Aaosphaeria arxii CBS 175.79]KAF2015520.1 nucleoside transporter family [Aaosphaeria arxii CBS 175.79]